MSHGVAIVCGVILIAGFCVLLFVYTLHHSGMVYGQ